MLRYADVKEVFAEIPDEITLAISFTGCPIHCKGCHSKYLWEDVGEFMTTKKLKDIIEAHTGITCVCFMGGDNQPDEINDLAYVVRHNFPNIKVAWYSGMDAIYSKLELENFDYIKYGKYEEEKGPLTSKTTNQIFLKRFNTNWEDMTYRFWKNESTN